MDVAEFGERLRRRVFEVGAVAGEAAEVHEAGGGVEGADVALSLLNVMDLEAVVDDGLDEGLLDRADGPEVVAVDSRETQVQFVVGGLGVAEALL